MSKENINDIKYYYNLVGNNRIRKVFKIPVGNLSREESEKIIKDLMDKYKESVPEDTEFPELNLSSDDNNRDISIWNELTTSEKAERMLSNEEQDKIFKKTGFVDWNQYDLDYLANYLEDKWKFSSTGDAFAIFKLIEFYRTHKDNLK